MQFVIVFSPEFSGKFQRNGGDIRFIEGLLILNGQSEVLELFFLFGKDDSDSTALAFGALNVYFSIVQAYQLPHQHQTDTASRYFGVDGICSTEVHLEQFSLFFGGNSYSIIFDFQSPGTFHVINRNEYIAILGSILQSIGYDIFQDRVHLLFVEPYIHVAEIAFVSESDMFYGGIGLEIVVYLLDVSIQFIFCYVQMRGIYFCPFKVYQIGSHAQEGVDISQCHVHIVGLGFVQCLVFKHFFQRCLYQCQWRADIMRGIDKETGFLIGYLFLFSQCHDTETDNGHQYCQQDIAGYGPKTEPDGARNADVDASLFKIKIRLFLGYRPYVKFVIARGKVGEAEMPFFTQAVPVIVKAFQLPVESDIVRRVIIDG